MSTLSNIFKDPLNLFRMLFDRPLKNVPPTKPSASPKGKEDKAEEKKVEEPKDLDIKAIKNYLDLVSQKIDSSDSLVKVLLVALLVAFVALVFGYFQFASNYYNDYAQKFKELNDDRYQELEKRVIRLENVKEATPTPQPKPAGQ